MIWKCQIQSKIHQKWLKKLSRTHISDDNDDDNDNKQL